MIKEKFINYIDSEVEAVNLFLAENPDIDNRKILGWKACFKHIKIIVESGEFDE